MYAEGKTIRRLPDEVIRKIKAGEVIVRPMNAVKELIENSLDALSTNICVSVKNGGKDCIKIRDNGHGILKEDLAFAIERHATSKLTEFEDLNNLKTLGFRGEALSSMAEVSCLTLISKTANDVCGYKILVKEGKIIEGPKPMAFNVGTTVILDEIFYNMPLRKDSLKSAAEEYSAIIDVVSKYAIHHSSKSSFVVEKMDSKTCELQTDLSASITDNIKLIYGNEVAQNLFTVELSDRRQLFEMTGLISKVNFNYKKFIFILFINDRLVDCALLKKSVLLVYKTFMPKVCHPFVYMNIKMNPENLDVNVHPQKYEVRFRYDEYIMCEIKNYLEDRLSSLNVHDSLSTKTSSPSVNLSQSIAKTNQASNSSPSSSQSTSKVLPSKKIRSDHLSQTLDNVWGRNELKIYAPPSTRSQSVVKNPHIKELREQIVNETSFELRELVKSSCFIGVVDSKFILVQFQTYLIIMHAVKLSVRLFYQLILDNITNFSKIKLSRKPNISQVLKFYIEENLTPEEQLLFDIDKALDTLMDASHLQTLYSYFGIEITSNGQLVSLPSLIQGYLPEFYKLGSFLYDLVTTTVWEDQLSYFKSICQALAKFYSLSERSGPQIDKVIANVIYPHIKLILRPSEADSDCFEFTVNTEKLYRVFERC